MGTEKKKLVVVRMNEWEYARVRGEARKRGLPIAAYVRWQACYGHQGKGEAWTEQKAANGAE